ncbi:MAG: protein adenylyltransferase SelO family protein [Myxococcota bacterium]
MTTRLAPLRPWEAPARLSERTRQKLLVPIPLAHDTQAGPRVLLVNFAELERLGVEVPRFHRLTKRLERALLERFALRPAVEGESPVATGFATRYQGYPGAVQGDGRAVLVAVGQRRDAQGRRRERVDVQLKGVATGLLPRRKDWASRHGKMFLSRALQEAFYADYLAASGVPSNRWLAIIDSGATITRPSDNVEVRVGLHVRSGQFWRMGHLWLFSDDRRALKDVLDEVAQLLASERGRKTGVTPARAYLLLLRRKVVELADAWWLRYAHGSFTPDNIGLFECLDQGTACTVDRTHVSFSAHRMGYGHVPELLMEEDYKRHLRELQLRAATRDERRALGKLKPAPLVRGWLLSRMTYQALRRLGLDEAQVRVVLRGHREAAVRLYRLVRSLADEVDRGREVAVGVKLTFRARHAARYDVFAALTRVVQLAARRELSQRQRALRLLPVLKPEADRTGLDLERALSLVEAVDGLVDLALGKMDEARRGAHLALWAERAKALNRRVRALEGGDSLDVAEQFVEARTQGASLGRIRARLTAFLRSNVVDGPGTALEAARRLRRGKAARLPDGRVIVSECVEGGVAIQQVSDGVRDGLRFVVATEGLRLDEPAALTLELRWGRARLQRAPVEVTQEEVVFEVPVKPHAPRKFRAGFVGTSGGKRRRVNNGGVGFGRWVPLLFEKLEVQVALAAEARRRGKARRLPDVVAPLGGTRAVGEAISARGRRKSAKARRGATRRRPVGKTRR